MPPDTTWVLRERFRAPASSILKLKGSQLQQDITELLVDVLGPDGVGFHETEEAPDGFDRLPEGSVDAMPTYFNYRKVTIYGGSSEVQRSIISKAILKF